MDNAVIGHDVRGDDMGAVNFYAVGRVDGEGSALNGGCGRQAHHIGGGHMTGNDVVGENGNQLRLVFGQKQRVNRSRRERREGVVGWGKDGERASALESFDESSSLHRRNQGLKRASATFFRQSRSLKRRRSQDVPTIKMRQVQNFKIL